MKLNDLLNEEFTAWEDIFIEHKGENEIIESMTNDIDLDSYDDSRNGDIINENDSRVIKQYDKKYGQDEYKGFDWNQNDPDEDDDIPEISRGNDARVIDQYLSLSSAFSLALISSFSAFLRSVISLQLPYIVPSGNKTALRSVEM